MGVPVSAATCHSLAPSRCIFTPSFRANSDILIISSCGKMVPLRVFSKVMTCVGELQSVISAGATIVDRNLVHVDVGTLDYELLHVR